MRACFCNAYPLILVDEFQDTDEDQWRLIQTLSEGSEIVALGDPGQRIYAWRRGVSETRLKDFSDALGAETFDFQDENNRSPATGIVGYARSLLSPTLRVDLPEDIVCKHFVPGRFEYGLRFALLETWRETLKRAGDGTCPWPWRHVAGHGPLNFGRTGTTDDGGRQGASTYSP